MTTSAASGTQSATIGTEHTLAAITTAGVYVLVLDTGAMTNGDTVLVRVKTKCKSGSTSRNADVAAFSHAQDAPNKYSVPIPIDTELVVTLQQTEGTGRSFDWNVLQL